jgi:hypothetical protein
MREKQKERNAPKGESLAPNVILTGEVSRRSHFLSLTPEDVDWVWNFLSRGRPVLRYLYREFIEGGWGDDGEVSFSDWMHARDDDGDLSDSERDYIHWEGPPDSARQFTHAQVDGLRFRTHAEDKKHGTFDRGVIHQENGHAAASDSNTHYGELFKLLLFEHMGRTRTVAIVKMYTTSGFKPLGLHVTELAKGAAPPNGARKNISPSSAHWKVEYGSTTCFNISQINGKFFYGDLPIRPTGTVIGVSIPHQQYYGSAAPRCIRVLFPFRRYHSLKSPPVGIEIRRDDDSDSGGSS